MNCWFLQKYLSSRWQWPWPLTPKWNQHLKQKERQPLKNNIKKCSQHSKCSSYSVQTVPASPNWFQQPESRGSSDTAAETTGLLTLQRLHQASVVCEDESFDRDIKWWPFNVTGENLGQWGAQRSHAMTVSGRGLPLRERSICQCPSDGGTPPRLRFTSSWPERLKSEMERPLQNKPACFYTWLTQPGQMKRCATADESITPSARRKLCVSCAHSKAETLGMVFRF